MHITRLQPLGPEFYWRGRRQCSTDFSLRRTFPATAAISGTGHRFAPKSTSQTQRRHLQHHFPASAPAGGQSHAWRSRQQYLSTGRRLCSPLAALSADELVAEESSDLSDADELPQTPAPVAATVRLLSAKDGEYTVEGIMHSYASADTVFQLLADYERVADIFSNVLRSSTHRTPGAVTRLQQVCRWEFLVFSGQFPLELTVTEEPGSRKLVFSLASSPFMRTFKGTWQVAEKPGGGCTVSHVMAVTPSLSPPRPLAFYTRRIFERQVAKILEDLSAAVQAS